MSKGETARGTVSCRLDLGLQPMTRLSTSGTWKKPGESAIRRFSESGKVIHRASGAAPSLWTLSVSVAALLAVMGHPRPASAQTEPAPPPASDQIEEIVVTGTQIRGSAPVGSTVISVGQTQIQQTGLSTTSDILRSIPQISSIGPGANTTGSGANNSSLNTNKANGLNLRGLGVQATLTLLDGHRVPPGGTGGQLFDPSSIPTIALKSIDVVADGASATYGSDAVAGVANLILRKDIEGIETDIRFGGASDYGTKQVDIIGGHAWDTGSFMIAGEWSYNDQLLQSDRLSLFQCNEIPNGYTNTCSYDAAPGNLYFPATKTRYGLPGGSGTGLTAANLSPTANLASPTYANLTSFPENDRKSVVAAFQQEVSDGIKFWAEGYYTKRNFLFGLGNASIDTATPVPSTNPNFISVPGQSQTSEVAQYSLVNDVGAQVATGYEVSNLVVLGGDIELPHDLLLTGSIEHGEDDEFLNRSNQINVTALRTALACTTPGTCFNPFGSGGSYNAAALNSFIGYLVQTSHADFDLVNVKVDGPIYTLPGGDVKIAIGTEDHRDSLTNFSYNNYNSVNLATTTIAANTEHGRTVNSVYAEMIVPIVGVDNALPFVRLLELDAAGRYDRYSDVGSTRNPKYGIRWKPDDDLTIHASYGTSFRAPTLSDINPFSTAAVLSSTTVSPGHNVLTLVGGNAAVKPETARTYSVGADYKPKWLDGLDFSVNFYHINYVNVIDTPALSNGSAVFTQPALFAPFVTLNPTAAQLSAITSLPYYNPPPFSVTPGNVYAIIDGRRNNVGALLTKGLDLAADYHWTTADWGDWDVGGTASYVFSYNYELVPGAPYINRVNQANYPLQFRARANASWNYGPLTSTVFLNYTNSYRVVGLLSPTQNQTVPDFATVDATFVYRLDGYADQTDNAAKDLTLTLSIQNLFDSAPPLALVSTSQQFDSTVASPLGRFVSFDIRKKF